MAKFSSIVRGTRQTKPIDVPPPIDAQATDEPRKCLLRPLNGTEEGLALVRAREDAIRAGVTKPAIGEPEYDLALQIHTIALGCVDVDDPKALYFDGGAEQVRESFGREAIALLYAVLDAWQDECAPTIKKLDPAAWATGVTTLGGPSEEEARAFLSRLRPGLLWIYVRSMAVTLVSSPSPSSPSGSSSETVGESVKIAPAPKSKSKRRRRN